MLSPSLEVLVLGVLHKQAVLIAAGAALVQGSVLRWAYVISNTCIVIAEHCWFPAKFSIGFLLVTLNAISLLFIIGLFFRSSNLVLLVDTIYSSIFVFLLFFSYVKAVCLNTWSLLKGIHKMSGWDWSPVPPPLPACWTQGRLQAALYAPVIIAISIRDFLTTILISFHAACYGILFRISIRLTRRYVTRVYLIENQLFC